MPECASRGMHGDTFEITSVTSEHRRSVRNSRASSTISNGCYGLTVERQRANSVESRPTSSNSLRPDQNFHSGDAHNSVELLHPPTLSGMPIIAARCRLAVHLG